MTNLTRSARTLNTILNIVFWVLVARGIFAAGYHIAALYKLFADPAALSGRMGLTIDWLTITADRGFGLDLDGAVPMKLTQLLSAIAITIIACRGIRILKRVLLPIERNQPFRRGISADILALSRCALWLGMAENLSMLAAVILIENHYHLPALLANDTITQVSVSPEFRPVWFIAAAVLSILSIVFRRGEELQTLADETL